MKSKRGGAIYCSRQCKNSARRARKRVDTQRAGHPFADEIRESAALTEAYANERHPDSFPGGPDPIELDDDADDEQGIHSSDSAPDPRHERKHAWAVAIGTVFASDLRKSGLPTRRATLVARAVVVAW